MELSKTKAADLIKSISDLFEKKRNIDWEFCKLLHTAFNAVVINNKKEVPLWSFAGFNSWSEFIESINIDVRRAEKYIGVYEKFKDHEVAAKKVEIRRLETALPLVNNYNASKIVKDAATLTRKNFKESLAKSNPIPSKTYTFKLTKKSDIEAVNKALDLGKAKFPKLTTTEIFLKLCETFTNQVK